jgi:uncharacterized coiled-coil protein SlyX
MTVTEERLTPVEEHLAVLERALRDRFVELKQEIDKGLDRVRHLKDRMQEFEDEYLKTPA